MQLWAPALYQCAQVEYTFDTRTVRRLPQWKVTTENLQINFCYVRRQPDRLDQSSASESHLGLAILSVDYQLEKYHGTARPTLRGGIQLRKISPQAANPIFLRPLWDSGLPVTKLMQTNGQISQFIICWSTTSGGHIPQLPCSLHFDFVFFRSL